MTNREHLLTVLDDAEQSGPVALATPHGLAVVTYHEETVNSKCVWFYSVILDGTFHFASAHEDAVVDTLDTIGVSFRRAS